MSKLGEQVVTGNASGLH